MLPNSHVALLKTAPEHHFEPDFGRIPRATAKDNPQGLEDLLRNPEQLGNERYPVQGRSRIIRASRELRPTTCLATGTRRLRRQFGRILVAGRRNRVELCQQRARVLTVERDLGGPRQGRSILVNGQLRARTAHSVTTISISIQLKQEFASQRTGAS